MTTTAGVFDSQPCTVEMTENKGRAFYIVNTAIKIIYNIKDFRLRKIRTSLWNIDMSLARYYYVFTRAVNCEYNLIRLIT